MAFFDNEQEVYDCIGQVFRESADHPTISPKLKAAGVTLQLHYADPEALLTIRFHDPIEVIEGETEQPADVHMYMASDDAHKFWLGNLNLAVALAKGQVRSKGPVNKILRLVPLVKPLFPIYTEIVTEKKGLAAA